MQQRLRILCVEVLRRNHCHAGIDALLHGLSLQAVDDCLDAEVAHIKRILHDDAVQLFRLHRIDEYLGGIEPDEHDLTGFANVLKRRKHACGGRFVGAEDSLHVIAEPI